MSARSKIARQYFLYGDEHGRRLTEVRALATASGCSQATIWKYLPEWVKEHEEILIRTNKPEFIIALGDEELNAFKHDTQFFRTQVSQIKAEIDLTETISTVCQEALDNAELTPKEFDKLSRLMENFFNAVHTKAKLRSQLVTMEKQWTSMVGIDGKMDIALTAEKERVKGKVRVEAKREAESDGQPRNAGGSVGGGIFSV